MTGGGIGVAAEVNDDIDVVTADNDIDDIDVTVDDNDDIGVTDLDGGVSINGNGWLTACSALLPNQGVVHIPGDECFTVYSLCYNLSKTCVLPMDVLYCRRNKVELFLNSYTEKQIRNTTLL